jgi:carbon-monoxide dehydrogenase small subunit
MSEHTVTLTVNGATEEVGVEARTLLVHALREELGYTGPKVGCERGKCGACTVHVDGDAVKSCTVLAVQADGADVTTVEGLADDRLADDGLHPVQDALHEEHGVQCGYCTPGVAMTAAALLDDDADPSRDEIRAGLKGNVCRCTGYGNVVDAVEVAADRTADGGGGDGRRMNAADRTDTNDAGGD